MRSPGSGIPSMGRRGTPEGHREGTTREPRVDRPLQSALIGSHPMGIVGSGG